jgi:hypothetical protein
MSAVATRTPVFDVDLLAALLRAPGQDYLALVERLRLEVAGAAPEAARHFGMFAERVRELDEAELEELYRESFGPVDAVALRRAAGEMRQSGCGACGDALRELERLLPSLESARNPFGVLFKAIVVLLIACRGGQEGTRGTA